MNFFFNRSKKDLKIALFCVFPVLFQHRLGENQTTFASVSFWNISSWNVYCILLSACFGTYNKGNSWSNRASDPSKAPGLDSPLLCIITVECYNLSEWYKKPQTQSVLPNFKWTHLSSTHCNGFKTVVRMLHHIYHKWTLAFTSI